MARKQQENSLARWIIERTNTDAYRAGTLNGYKHPRVDSSLITAVGGIHALIDQAKQMERDEKIGGTGKICFVWRDMGRDIEKFTYDVAIVEELCKREGIIEPRSHQQELIARVRHWRKQVKECEWVTVYYDDVLRRLLEGKIVTEAEDETLFRCINAVVCQKEFVWERVFSARVLRDSKKFKKEYFGQIFTILKNYSPYYEEGMSEDEIFDMHNIHSYAQTLEWKGGLQYKTDGKIVVDTSSCRYGTVINSQAMEHSVPIQIPQCKKIMTIENKANYMDMTYAAATLYIFCHGYFTPKEVRFLKDILTIVNEDCEFYHWGDMDYGGISIFQFVKEHVFPKLRPYKMDVESFKKALAAGGGVKLEESTRKKLEKKDAGELTPLKDIILETGWTIEQEMVL